MKRIKTIAALGAVTIATLGLTACDESYDAVNDGSGRVLVTDMGDKVDPGNFRDACAKQGKQVGNVTYVGNGRTQALVECR